VHGPRAHGLELNVAEARRVQVASRQAQLDAFLRRAVTTFNARWASAEAARSSTGCACSRTSSRPRAAQSRSTCSGATDRRFAGALEREAAAAAADVERFAETFRGSNDRFRSAVDDGSCSGDEREMIARAFETLDAHARPRFDALRERAPELRADYDARLPHHQADVALVEAVAALHQEARSRFDTFLSKSRLQEGEIDIARGRARRRGPAGARAGRRRGHRRPPRAAPPRSPSSPRPARA
jgi:hypothetical protein